MTNVTPTTDNNDGTGGDAGTTRRNIFRRAGSAIGRLGKRAGGAQQQETAYEYVRGEVAMHLGDDEGDFDFSDIDELPAPEDIPWADEPEMPTPAAAEELTYVDYSDFGQLYPADFCAPGELWVEVLARMEREGWPDTPPYMGRTINQLDGENLFCGVDPHNFDHAAHYVNPPLSEEDFGKQRRHYEVFGKPVIPLHLRRDRRPTSAPNSTLNNVDAAEVPVMNEETKIGHATPQVPPELPPPPAEPLQVFSDDELFEWLNTPSSEAAPQPAEAATGDEITEEIPVIVIEDPAHSNNEAWLVLAAKTDGIDNPNQGYGALLHDALFHESDVSTTSLRRRKLEQKWREGAQFGQLFEMLSHIGHEEAQLLAAQYGITDYPQRMSPYTTGQLNAALLKVKIMILLEELVGTLKITADASQGNLLPKHRLTLESLVMNLSLAELPLQSGTRSTLVESDAEVEELIEMDMDELKKIKGIGIKRADILHFTLEQLHRIYTEVECGAAV